MVTASTATALLKTTCLTDQRGLEVGAQILPRATAWALTLRRPPIPGTSGESITPQYLYRCALSVVGVDTYLSPSGGIPQPTTKTPVSLPHPPPSG